MDNNQKFNSYAIKNDLEAYTIILERLVKASQENYNTKPSPAITAVHNHIVRLADMLKNISDSEFQLNELDIPYINKEASELEDW